MSRSLAARFQRGVAGAGRPQPPPRDVERLLGAVLDRVQASNTGVRIDAERFVDCLSERAGSAPDIIAYLEGVHAEDLSLACACLEGQRAAIQRLQQSVIAPLVGDLARQGLGGVAPDALQLVAERLLVGRAGQPPKLRDYTGQRSLHAWLRVVALRLAIDLARREKPHAELLDGFDAAVGDDPELAVLKGRYRAHFARAFEEAIDCLSARERAVLRLHHLDAMTTDEIAALYRVHRVTVSRWLSTARATVLQRTRDRLKAELDLGSEELASFDRLLESYVDLSISRLLPRAASDRSA